MQLTTSHALINSNRALSHDYIRHRWEITWEGKFFNISSNHGVHRWFPCEPIFEFWSYFAICFHFVELKCKRTTIKLFPFRIALPGSQSTRVLEFLSANVKPRIPEIFWLRYENKQVTREDEFQMNLTTMLWYTSSVSVVWTRYCHDHFSCLHILACISSILGCSNLFLNNCPMFDSSGCWY